MPFCNLFMERLA